jgi:hypothetical protein
VPRVAARGADARALSAITIASKLVAPAAFAPSMTGGTFAGELIGGGALGFAAVRGSLGHVSPVTELHALSCASRVAKTLLLDGKRRHHGHVVAGRDQGAGAFTKNDFWRRAVVDLKPIPCSNARRMV